MVRLKVLGGLGEIGGNCILVEDGETRWLLDCGLPLWRFRRLFEDFLRPRAARGLTDFWRLGFLSPYDWYREDLRPADLDLALEPCPLSGVLLTHAHLDHYGLLGLLREDISVYLTPETAALLKALQGVGATEFWREWVAVRPREELSLPRHNVLQAVRQSRRWRPFVLPTRPETLLRFWCLGEGEGVSLPQPEYVLKQGLPEQIRFVPVYHSVPGAVAVALDTSAGTLLYTGDLRFGPAMPLESWLRCVKPLTPRVLLIEGTYVGEEPRGVANEAEVVEALLEALGLAHGRLLVAGLPSVHLERLAHLLLAAKESSRQVLLLPRDFWLLIALEAAAHKGLPPLEEAPLGLYPEPKASFSPVERYVLSKYASLVVDPREIEKDPGAFVLCLSLTNLVHLLDLSPEILAKAFYVSLQGEAHSEEVSPTQKRVFYWLQHLGIKPLGLGEQTLPFHAPSHACEAEIWALIEALDPEEVIPVHTRHPEIFKQRLGAKVPDSLPEVCLC